MQQTDERLDAGRPGRLEQDRYTPTAGKKSQSALAQTGQPGGPASTHCLLSASSYSSSHRVFGVWGSFHGHCAEPNSLGSCPQERLQVSLNSRPLCQLLLTHCPGHFPPSAELPSHRLLLNALHRSLHAALPDQSLLCLPLS